MKFFPFMLAEIRGEGPVPTALLRKEDDNNKATLAANCDFKNVDSSVPS